MMGTLFRGGKTATSVLSHLKQGSVSRMIKLYQTSKSCSVIRSVGMWAMYQARYAFHAQAIGKQTVRKPQP